ncbi:MAG: hypothetical protein HKN48_06110 [Flavobacteriaceae bacterium]|nr:hypothetical protein [Flavobacteriaceae bacterium]
MKQLVFKSTLFIILLIGMLSLLDDVFIYKKTGPVALVNSFYEAAKNEIDILCLGNSHMNRGIDPILLEAKTGLRTEMLVGGGLEIAHIYYNLRNALETQRPKLVIIETYPLSMRNSINNKANNEITQTLFGYKTMMKYGAFTYRGMAVGKRGGDIFDRFSIFPFHEEWAEPDKFYLYLEKKKEYNSGLEFQQIQRKSPFIPQAQIDVFNTKKFDGEDIHLIPQEKRYLRKILDLSREFNFQLMIFTVPVYDAYYKQTKEGMMLMKKQIEELTKDYGNTSYFDYNDLLGGVDDSYLINERVIGKSQHLNYKGILQTTDAVASFIKEQYSFGNETNTSNRNTVESFVFSGNHNSGPSLIGDVISINGKSVYGSNQFDTITLKKWVKKVNIKGWFTSENEKDTLKSKKIILRKDDRFVFISEAEVKPWRNPLIDKLFGAEKRKFGYTFNLDKRMLLPGEYEVFHLIENSEGAFGIQKMKPLLRID